jgi:hypothetical protein
MQDGQISMANTHSLDFDHCLIGAELVQKNLLEARCLSRSTCNYCDGSATHE